MARKSDGSSSITAAQARALPWPAALKSRTQALKVDECYDVGRMILEQLGWQDTRGRQEWSLRRLQAEVLKAASVSTLSRCVRVYRVAKELNLKPPWRNLDMRHFVATASLPAAKRKDLLKRVDKEGWSAAKLERLVRERYGSPGRGGKTEVECVRALDELERRNLFGDLPRLNLYTRAELRKLLKRTQRAQRELGRLQAELEQRLAGSS